MSWNCRNIFVYLCSGMILANLNHNHYCRVKLVFILVKQEFATFFSEFLQIHVIAFYCFLLISNKLWWAALLWNLSLILFQCCISLQLTSSYSTKFTRKPAYDRAGEYSWLIIVFENQTSSIPSQLSCNDVGILPAYFPVIKREVTHSCRHMGT